MQTTILSVASALDSYQVYRGQESYSEFALSKWGNPRKLLDLTSSSWLTSFCNCLTPSAFLLFR